MKGFLPKLFFSKSVLLLEICAVCFIQSSLLAVILQNPEAFSTLLTVDVIEDTIMRCRIILQNVSWTSGIADLGCTTTTEIKFSHMIVTRWCLNRPQLSPPCTTSKIDNISGLFTVYSLFPLPIPSILMYSRLSSVNTIHNCIMKD